MDTKIHMLLVQTYQPRQATPNPFVAAMFNILALCYIHRCCHVIAASFSQTFSRNLPFQNVYTFNAAHYILPKPRMQPFHLQTFVLQRRRQSVASKFPGRHFTVMHLFIPPNVMRYHDSVSRLSLLLKPLKPRTSLHQVMHNRIASLTGGTSA